MSEDRGTTTSEVDVPAERTVKFRVHASAIRDFEGECDPEGIADLATSRKVPNGARLVQTHAAGAAWVSVELLDRVQLEVIVKVPESDIVDDSLPLPTYRIGGNYGSQDETREPGDRDLTPLLSVVDGSETWSRLDVAVEAVLGEQFRPWVWQDDVQVLSISPAEQAPPIEDADQ